MADLRPMASATELNHVMAPLEPGSVVYRERSRVFILNGAKSSYAFRVDAHGWLEHLYWGPQVDASDELGYLSFANVSLPFDPKPSASGEENDEYQTPRSHSVDPLAASDPAFMQGDRFRLNSPLDNGAQPLDRPDTRALPPIARGPPVPIDSAAVSSRLAPPVGDDGFMEAGEIGGSGAPVYRTSFRHPTSKPGVHESKSVSALMRGAHAHSHAGRPHADPGSTAQQHGNSADSDAASAASDPSHQSGGAAASGTASDSTSSRGPPHPAASDMHHAASAEMLQRSTNPTGAATGAGSRVAFLASGAAEPHSAAPGRTSSVPVGAVVRAVNSEGGPGNSTLAEHVRDLPPQGTHGSRHYPRDRSRGGSQGSSVVGSDPGTELSFEAASAGAEAAANSSQHPGGAGSSVSAYTPTAQLAQEIIDRIGQPDSAIVTASLPAPIGEALPQLPSHFLRQHHDPSFGVEDSSSHQHQQLQTASAPGRELGGVSRDGPSAGLLSPGRGEAAESAGGRVQGQGHGPRPSGASMAPPHLRLQPSLRGVDLPLEGGGTENGDGGSSLQPQPGSNSRPQDREAESELHDSPGGEAGIQTGGDQVDDGARSRSQSVATSLQLAPEAQREDAETEFEVIAGHNMKLLEWSEGGTGDYRVPSFEVRYADGSTISPVQYCSHRIFAGRHRPDEGALTAGFQADLDDDEMSMASAADMPRVRSLGPRDARTTTLVVTLVDRFMKLFVDLVYTVCADSDVIVRKAVVRNIGRRRVVLNRFMSATIDMYASDHHLTHLSGAWAGERQVVTRKLVQGICYVESRRGQSSHQHNPFVAVSEGKPREESGEVYGFSLVYSGNFRIECDVAESQRLRINAGLHPANFRWQLLPGQTFETPEVMCVYSSEGMGGMSKELHEIIRRRLVRPQWRYHIPSVIVNSWEACYFDINEKSIIELATHARDVVPEDQAVMLVMDDGWFGARNNDTSSLGDWFVDKTKFPKGLRLLGEQLDDIGVHFGLWVEPEMVNVRSQLYRQHPDWCLQVPGRRRSEGRNQLVLDFSRDEVVEYILTRLTSILATVRIRYVKWDCNRSLSEVYSAALPPARQGETFYRHLRGVYRVFRELNERFPHILIESCSGGGGRFDPGMLFYSSQIWASDNTDAISRLSIQHGTSLVYPISTVGAHISTVPNHQTLRVTSLKTRFLVALAGTFGLELDIRKLTEEEREELRQFIRLRDELSPIVYWGRQHRLWSPFEGNKTAAWMFVAEGRELERATRLQHFYDEWRETVAEGIWAVRPDVDGSAVDVELPGRRSAEVPPAGEKARGTAAKAAHAASTAVGDKPPNSGRLKPSKIRVKGAKPTTQLGSADSTSSANSANASTAQATATKPVTPPRGPGSQSFLDGSPAGSEDQGGDVGLDVGIRSTGTPMGPGEEEGGESPADADAAGAGCGLAGAPLAAAPEELEALHLVREAEQSALQRSEMGLRGGLGSPPGPGTPPVHMRQLHGADSGRSWGLGLDGADSGPGAGYPLPPVPEDASENKGGGGRQGKLGAGSQSSSSHDEESDFDGAIASGDSTEGKQQSSLPPSRQPSTSRGDAGPSPGTGLRRRRARWPDRAVVMAFCINKDAGQTFPRLKLRGLSPHKRYQLQEICPGTLSRAPATGQIVHNPSKPVWQFGSLGSRGITLSGKALMSAGLPVRFEFDGDSVVYTLTEVGMCE